MNWTPLASTLPDSSVWRLPDPIRIAWVTILAKKDHRTHHIRMNAWLLSDWARISEESALEALRIFQDKDPRSLDQKDEGRRLKDLGNGEYLVINGDDYKQRMTLEKNREDTRQRMADIRSGQRIPRPRREPGEVSPPNGAAEPKTLNGTPEPPKEPGAPAPAQDDPFQGIPTGESTILQNQARILLKFFNQQTEKDFQETPENMALLIHALRRTNGDLPGLQQMIHHRAKQWINDPKMNDHLKISTVFGRNFQQYYDVRSSKTPEEIAQKKQRDPRHIIDPSDPDFDGSLSQWPLDKPAEGEERKRWERAVVAATQE